MTDSRLTDSQRVVVTGLGATTPLGGDVASTWSAMLAGQSGVKVLTEDWVDMLPVHIAAPVAVDPSEVLPRPLIKRSDRSGQFAIIASREAWADAGAPEVDPERIGVVIASGIGGVTTLLDAYDVLKEKGARRVLPMTVPMLMPNGPAALVGLELVARAGVHTPVSACSSGAEAIAYAVDMIRNGRADIVAAGGTEAAIHPLPLAGFAAMQALSTRNDEPGAGLPALRQGPRRLRARRGRRRAGAREPGARQGSRRDASTPRSRAPGITSDAHHMAAARPGRVGGHPRHADGASRRPARRPSDVVHINAHATSTPVGDVAEAEAIRNGPRGRRRRAVRVGDQVDDRSPARRGGRGRDHRHHPGAAGPARRRPTTNLEDPDDDVHLDVVRGEPRALPDGDRSLALNNSFGFGGHNVALAVRSVQQ